MNARPFSNGINEKSNGSDNIKFTFLLVDDNKMAHQLVPRMANQVAPDQITWLHAYNGQEAIEMFQKYNLQNYSDQGNQPSIDAIVMDNEMPIKQGYIATAEIRALEATNKISSPVYIYTFSDSVAGKYAEANDKLKKPFDKEDFKNKIESFKAYKARNTSLLFSGNNRVANAGQNTNANVNILGESTCANDVVRQNVLSPRALRSC